MKREYYSDRIEAFLDTDASKIHNALVQNHPFNLEQAQRDAWLEQIRIMKNTLAPYRQRGKVYFEYSIPRLGKRIDTLAVIGPAIFVLEFKVGEHEFPAHAIDQVWDYALDLKNFHESSHKRLVVPILVATEADLSPPLPIPLIEKNQSTYPIRSSAATLPWAIGKVLQHVSDRPIQIDEWEHGRYCPTPTIVEAATALYGGHTVAEISRSDASAVNLSHTSDSISQVIHWARDQSRKVVCFVTGVPGAGKTLVGLNVATQHIDKDNDLYSVFLSGNGPLVTILREALARDKVQRLRYRGQETTKSKVMSEVKMFIQNVHNFRDECLSDVSRPPVEHVALFDEAQRAWNREQTANFMRRKKRRADFDRSEPEFLISCMDRHRDWAVIVCLVGGGQEINTGEAGISEWIDSLAGVFSHWDIVVSPRITDSEYDAGHALERLKTRGRVQFKEELHLAVSMRSFRAEHVSLLVKQMLDIAPSLARQTLAKIEDKYPIAITRDLNMAKQWLKQKSRGSERYGIVVSSQAQRLKPHAIDVKAPVEPIHWFLGPKTDVRSSYYLEDVATEFHVQGLELDWACVTWDADFRYTPNGWDHWSFRGHRWNRINKAERKTYLKNAYRVLLTRARQGMVIVVPDGEPSDPTRNTAYYDPTYDYLCEIGLPQI